MAKNTQLATATVTRQADDLAARLNDGYCRVYSATQPATADTAIVAQTLLAELRFDNPAAPGAVDGVITFSPLTADPSTNAAGTAAWYRALETDGTTVVMDGSVGTSDANMIVNSVSVGAGVEFAIGSCTHTVAKSTPGT